MHTIDKHHILMSEKFVSFVYVFSVQTAYSHIFFVIYAVLIQRSLFSGMWW